MLTLASTRYPVAAPVRAWLVDGDAPAFRSSPVAAPVRAWPRDWQAISPLPTALRRRLHGAWGSFNGALRQRRLVQN